MVQEQTGGRRSKRPVEPVEYARALPLHRTYGGGCYRGAALLSRPDFSYADFFGASFFGANCSGASFGSAVPAASEDSAYLEGMAHSADLSRSDLPLVPLTLAQLVRSPQAMWPLSASADQQVAWARALVGGDLRRVPLPPRLASLKSSAQVGDQAEAPAWMTIGWAAWASQVQRRVSEKRQAHVYRVALLAAQLAYHAGLDSRRAFAAGVLHDLARDLSEAELLRLAPPKYSGEAEHPLAVHGRAARNLLENLGFDDPEVLDAVEDHVAGPRPAACAEPSIAACVYIADVSEPARGFNDDIRELAFEDLQAALHAAITSKVKYLQGRGLKVHPQTMALHEALQAAQASNATEEGRAGAGDVSER